MRKVAPPSERICPKIRLTDRECGQNGCQCAVPKLWGRNQGKAVPSAKPYIQWRQGHDCYLKRSSVVFGERQADKRGYNSAKVRKLLK